ncbi:MAG: hypothetical protein ACYC75_02600 [Minisyncoccota bacterium]
MERAKNVLGTLYTAYVHNQKLFRHVNREMHAPQRRHFPCGVPKGSLGHRQWLFFAAMTDRREESERVYASHARLATRAPELYTRSVVKMASHEIAAILKSEKVGSPEQSARYWPRSAETLFGEFLGDPLNLYQKGRIDDLLEFKRNGHGDKLPGFGPKILSLLALFYAELGLIGMPEDAFPVDVHVQRFAISTGIIRSSGRIASEKVEKVLRPLLCKIIFEEGWSALELSHAIWFQGGRLCNGCYRNSVSELLCPSYNQCDGSISTTSYFRKGVWDFDAARHRKGGDRNFTLPDFSPLFIS